MVQAHASPARPGPPPEGGGDPASAPQARPGASRRRAPGARGTSWTCPKSFPASIRVSIECTRISQRYITAKAAVYESLISILKEYSAVKGRWRTLKTAPLSVEQNRFESRLKFFKCRWSLLHRQDPLTHCRALSICACGVRHTTPGFASARCSETHTL